jgi:hypothetical protein
MRLIVLIALIAVSPLLYASDGTIWLGNPDGSPLVLRIGSVEKIPVWIQTNSDVYAAAIHIPLATDDRYISERLGVDLFAPFVNDNVPEGYDKGWDAASPMDPIPHPHKPGFTSQGLLGFMDLAGGRNIPLHCEKKCKILEFKVKTAAVDSLRGHTYNDVLIKGFQEQNKGFHFSDTLGNRSFDIEAVFSPIYFVYPGDINDDLSINNTDLEDLQSYLDGKKKLPWPEQRADLDGNGKIDDKDLKKLRELIAK